MKPKVSRKEYLAQAASEYDAMLRAYEETLPRHAHLGAYLAEHPVAGVEVVDRSDGLGPRALDWPEGMPHPDVDAWVLRKTEEQITEAEAKVTAEETARQAALQEKTQLREDIEKASNTTALRALMIKALERLGAI